MHKLINIEHLLNMSFIPAIFGDDTFVKYKYDGAAGAHVLKDTLCAPAAPSHAYF